MTARARSSTASSSASDGSHSGPRGSQDVPREELDLVERGQIQEQVAAHEPQAAEVEDAELLRIRVARSAPQPRFRAGEELAGRLVGGIELE